MADLEVSVNRKQSIVIESARLI